MSDFKTFKTSVSINQHILDKIKVRGSSVSSIIRRDLERLYVLYERALTQVDLTKDERNLIIEALNGVTADANTARLLWAQVEDVCTRENLHKKWRVDCEALIEKLKGYNEIQCLAIIDAVEKYWHGSCSDDEIWGQANRAMLSE